MKNAVDEWEDTVIWDRGGVNIITTTDYPLPAGDSCSSTTIPPEEGRFEVRFVSDGEIKDSCNPLLVFVPWVDGPPACWRSHSWEHTGVQLIDRGSVLLNADRGAAYWNQNLAAGCEKLHEMLVHEVGHAFGIGKASLRSLDEHPKNTTLSIMSKDSIDTYCEPQVYDIVAVTALYQSR